jgi:hypothetical protein
MLIRAGAERSSRLLLLLLLPSCPGGGLVSVPVLASLYYTLYLRRWGSGRSVHVVYVKHSFYFLLCYILLLPVRTGGGVPLRWRSWIWVQRAPVSFSLPMPPRQRPPAPGRFAIMLAERSTPRARRRRLQARSGFIACRRPLVLPCHGRELRLSFWPTCNVQC